MHFLSRTDMARLRPGRTSVLVTIDTEPDDAWYNHLCESVQNVRALRRLNTLLKRHGAKATLLVTYRVIHDPECLDILRELVQESGAEVGAHLHPWETPPFMASGADVRHPTFPHELPLQVFADKLARLTDAITERIGPPTSYRAGRWGLAAEHLPILEQLGYEVDTSVMPLVDWRSAMGMPLNEHGNGGVDYRFAPQEPYRPAYADVTRRGDARIVEIPVTVGFTRVTPASIRRAYGALPELAQRALRKTGILRPVWATPAWEAGVHLQRLARTSIRGAVPVMNIACHSSEFTVSSLPDCDTPEKIDDLFRRVDALLQIFSSQECCDFSTLTETGRAWRARCERDDVPAPVVPAVRAVELPAYAPVNGHMAGGRRSSPPRGQSARTRLVYILAASHSGSTLLTMLLGGHPRIGTVGELKATIEEEISQYPCSCGDAITQCAFWARIRAGMAQRGLAFDITRPYTDIQAIDSAYVRRLLRPLHRNRKLERLRDAALSLSPTWRREIRAIQQRNSALARTICEASGCDVIVDSSKYALRLKYLLRDPELDVQIIRLIRDGRGVALTYYLDERRVAMGPAAREWRRSNEEAEALLATVPRPHWTEVRYEDLCAAPLPTLKRLCEFIGVDPRRASVDFRAHEHHIVGNWMRLERTNEIRLDDRWRTTLTGEDLRAFDAVAGELNRRYGYR